jgi:hypothetical protein
MPCAISPRTSRGGFDLCVTPLLVNTAWHPANVLMRVPMLVRMLTSLVCMHVNGTTGYRAKHRILANAGSQS